MAVTADKPAPYAPASAIIDIIDRYRNKGLPTPVTAEVLGRAGISDSLIPRTLQALQTLDLIGEDGRPTQVFEGIRRAPEAELRLRLAEWLQGAYADALQFVDPATADEIGIRDAFRSYNPVGQQPRMVTLFSGLFKAAGIGPEKSVKSTSDRPVQLRTIVRARAPRPITERKPAAPPLNHSGGAPPGLPPALAGLLSSLPKTGEGWTQVERDRFVQTFGAVLDFCFPIHAEGERDIEDYA
jgi:hypothetical protein